MREKLCAALGLLGGLLATALGGWNAAVTALLIFMAVDFVSGSIVALVFHRSSKTGSGSYRSSYGFRGLMKKFMALMVVLVAHQLDLLLGCDSIRDAVCIGFLTNELLSITENAGLMGLPLPRAVTQALELLQKK